LEVLFDAELAKQRRLRALRTPVSGADFLMVRAVEDLTERLSTVERRFPIAAAINCLTGHAAVGVPIVTSVGLERKACTVQLYSG